jgi:cytochrome P450
MFLHYNSISGFYLSGQEWRKLRKMFSPAFSPSTLDIYFEVFKNNAEILVQALMTKVGAGEFDVCPYLNHYSFDCIVGKYIKLSLRNL